MHPALLIDEILQLIFETILDDGKSPLYRAARCCQAWKDPALDRIWRRLPSAVPLLSLLPGFSIENNVIHFDSMVSSMALLPFRSYAARVKHIVHCHCVFADLNGIPMHLFRQMINLESARIEGRANVDVALRMSLAPRLRSVTLQVGYTKSNSTSTTVRGMISLLKGSSLEQLSVRGRSSECLDAPLSNMTTLRSLSLHLSSLTEQSFMTVSTFPYLVHFDIHADRLAHTDLSTAIARASDAAFFPALEKLKIRARLVLVALILQHLPRHKLRSLDVDATGSDPTSAFESLFTTMTTLPLSEFTLEHTISTGDSDDTPTYTPKFFTLDHLRPLSKLPLRSFTLDVSLPPDLSDTDIEEMSRWWPRVERLELGARTALENAETSWTPRTSLASLSALARECKHLDRLVITLDADSRSLPDLGAVTVGSHPLSSLSISSRSRPDVSSLSAMLSRLFPSLKDVTPELVGEREVAWDAV